MKLWGLLIGVIYLGACNPKEQTEVSLRGRIDNRLGDKVVLDVCGQDSVFEVPLNAEGRFAFNVKLANGKYARLLNGKAVFPLYLAPGMEMELEVDAQEVKRGNYTSVTLGKGISKETQMMAHYYEHQWFPSSQEMFSQEPDDYRKLLQAVVNHNDSIIDAFLKQDSEKYDQRFVKLFKLQIKVPLAVSCFYYPTYHNLLGARSDKELSEYIDVFDKMLPKNDSAVYNNVYRYKTYEVAYWNNIVTDALVDVADEDIVNAYFDKLEELNVLPQIRRDAARIFFMQEVTGLSLQEKDLIEKRIGELER